MTTPRDPLYAGCRDPAEIISDAVWLYVRFPLSRRTVEERLAARGLSVTYQTLRQCGLKLGRACANRMRRRAPRVPITDKLRRYAAAKREIIPPPAFHRLRRWNLGRLRPASSTGRTKARTTGRTTPTHRPGGESRS